MAEGGMSARPPRLNSGELRLDKPVLRRPPQGEPAVTRLDEPEVSVIKLLWWGIILKNMCDSDFPNNPLILVPTQKFLCQFSKMKIENLHFDENYNKIRLDLGKLFTVYHSDYQYIAYKTYI